MEEQETDNAEEVLLHFKRFPKEKQDQVRALVNYATLMGLNGKDLVSIGGKLNRIDAKKELAHNESIVSAMDIRPIGKDRDCYRRWAYTDAIGVVYHFSCSYYRYEVTNIATKKVSKGYVNDRYPVGRGFHIQNNRDLPNIMLNLYNGKFQLP